MPETTPDPMPLADVPVELVDLFDEGSFAAAKADTSTSPITAEQAYIRGGLAAVIPVVRATVAEEILAAEVRVENATYEHAQGVADGMKLAADLARGERP
jgi:hypothetical protein